METNSTFRLFPHVLRGNRDVNIAVQPLGKVPADRVRIVRDCVAKQFRAKVTVLPARALPAQAYYKPRGRYRAEKILDWLEQNTGRKFDKVLAITEADISTTKGEYADWGVFGLGNVGGRPCIVSSFRLRNVPPARFRARYANVVTHEFGHTFGLNHCPTPGCVMQDAEGTVKTVDNESGDFCPKCRAFLDR